jgi:hypothetical protein
MYKEMRFSIICSREFGHGNEFLTRDERALVVKGPVFPILCGRAAEFGSFVVMMWYIGY